MKIYTLKKDNVKTTSNIKWFFNCCTEPFRKDVILQNPE